MGAIDALHDLFGKSRFSRARATCDTDKKDFILHNGIGFYHRECQLPKKTFTNVIFLASQDLIFRL